MAELSSKSKFEYRQKIIDLWKTSNLRQEDFCLKKGISLNNFKYWQKQLRKQKRLPKKSHSVFVPIQVIRDVCGSVQKESKFILHCCNGRRLTIPEGFNEIELYRLLRCVDA